MNKDNAKDYLPLIQALADGRTIQVKLSTCSSFEDSTGDMIFGLDASYYRIKPEPREFWVVIGKDEGIKKIIGTYQSAEYASLIKKELGADEVIKLVEDT